MESFIEKCERLLTSERKEIGNEDRFFKLKDICMQEYTDRQLTVPVGKMQNGENVFLDFIDVSGLFIGGTTGSGKSIFIDDLVVILMLKNTSKEVKFIFLDPKKIELGEYDGIKYICENKKNINNEKSARYVLSKLLELFKNRIDALKQTRHTSIITYNKDENNAWPHLFVVIDEGNFLLSDDIKTMLEYILKCGNKVGIHLIFATNSYLKEHQDFIKLFKYRMTFDMASLEQAKYIDLKGSSWLLGGGEGMIKNLNKTLRFQAPFISDGEIQNVVMEVGMKN